VCRADVRNDRTARPRRGELLEVVVVPVSNVDRAKDFYAEQLGFEVDHDTVVGEGRRVVHRSARIIGTCGLPHHAAGES